MTRSNGFEFANWNGRSAIERLRETLTGDDLLHHGTVMAAATVLGGVCNYAFQVFMGRALGPEAYGVFGALFALFYLLNVFGRGVTLSASRFAAELVDRPRALAAFHYGLLGRTVLFGTLVFGILAGLSGLVSRFLGLDSPVLVVVVAGTVPAALALTANQGSLQGVQWFVGLGSSVVLRAALKLGLGVGLVVVGFGLVGAFAALALSAVAVLVLTTAYLWWRLPARSRTTPSFDYARAYRYVLPAVLAGFCLTVPSTVDVILVKHFFTSHEAGLYTAASVLGKALVFLPMGISTALFPKVSDGHVDGRPARLDGLFDRAFLYSAALAGAGAAVYWLAPTLILSNLFGPAYADAAPLLRWYGLAVLAFVLAAVVLNFELARDRTRFVYAFTAATVAEILLVWVAHGSMVQVVQVLLVVNAAVLGYGLFIVKR